MRYSTAFFVALLILAVAHPAFAGRHPVHGHPAKSIERLYSPDHGLPP